MKTRLCHRIILLSVMTFAAIFISVSHAESKPSDKATSNNTASSDKKTERRAYPAPFDSIFPNSEYPGSYPSPVIGVPKDPTIYPLTDALWDNLPELKKHDIRIYGWLNPSFNVTSSKNSNLPMSNDIVPNQVQLQEAVLYIEKKVNTVQTEHVDWGFEINNLYGIDYRSTTAQGIFSNQVLQHNLLYGYDPVEVYGQLYFPQVKQGMVITVGRYGSPTDIDFSYGPYGYFLTRSLALSVQVGTQTGINAAIKFNNNWTVSFGLNAGGDLAPWAEGAHIPTLFAMVRWVSKSNNDSIWAGVDSFNGGKFKGNHDNLQQFNLSWTHRFTPQFFTATEIFYLFQFDSPMGGTCNFGPLRSFSGGGDGVGGGGCGPLIPGYSSAIGVANYTAYKLSKKDFITFRTDYLDDSYGQRTAFATEYMSFTLGVTHVFRNFLEIRPEARYEFAFSKSPYDNGTRHNQTTLGADLIYRF